MDAKDTATPIPELVESLNELDAKDTKDAADADATIPELVKSMNELRSLIYCPPGDLIKQCIPELERILKNRFRGIRAELEQEIKKVIQDNNTLKTLANALNKKAKARKNQILEQATELEAARTLHNFQAAQLKQFHAAYQKQVAELEMLDTVQERQTTAYLALEQAKAKQAAESKTLRRAHTDQAAELKTLRRAHAKQAAELKTLRRAHAKQAAELKKERTKRQKMKQARVELIVELKALEKKFLASSQALQNTTVTCRVCLENPKDTLFQPCRHLACCAQCAEKITICPICRALIAEKVKCFV